MKLKESSKFFNALADETRQSYRTEDMPAESVALFLDGLQPGNMDADRAD